MGYLYAIIAIIGFTVLGVTYKLSDRLDCDKRQVNLFLFATAAVAVLIWRHGTDFHTHSLLAFVFGITFGTSAFVNITIFRKAVAKGRISTSWTIINLTLIVPVLISALIWREFPAPRHYLGLALTVVAIVLLGIDVGRAKE